MYSIPLSERTIAEMLKEGFPAGIAKYRCGFFGKWDTVATTPTWNHAANPIWQGFDRFFGPTNGNDPDHFSWPAATASSPLSVSIHQNPVTTFPPVVLREKAVEWISTASEPFFVQVSFTAPHRYYQVPPFDGLSQETKDQIQGLGFNPGDDLTDTDCKGLAFEWLVESLDYEIGQLIDGLGTKAAKTTIFVTADNGTPGAFVLPPLIGGEVTAGGHGKGSIFEQGIRVPLVASGYLVTGSGVHEDVVSLADLWATIAELAGAAPGTGGDDSVSLYPALQNPQLLSNPPRMVFSQIFRPNGPYSQAALPEANVRAMMTREWKYIRVTSSVGSLLHGAFHLSDSLLTPVDPAECSDLWQNVPIEHQGTVMALSDAMTSLSGYY